MVATREQEGISDPGAAVAKAPSLVRRLAMFLAIVAFIVVATFGYWLWYVTSAPSQFNSPGMDLNNMMPAALNDWGCARLQERFADGPAPFGCAGDDYRSWK